MVERSLLQRPHSASGWLSRRGRPALSLVAVVALGLAACGGSDDDTGAIDSGAADSGAADTSADAVDGSGAAGPATTLDAASIRACLADAGYETTTSSDLLSEQQVADQLTLFGQTDSLTFDAATTSFAGGVSFYETPEQAAERAENLADAALELRVVANALISVEAGSEYDDAVAAAEACLDG